MNDLLIVALILLLLGALLIFRPPKPIWAARPLGLILVAIGAAIILYLAWIGKLAPLNNTQPPPPPPPTSSTRLALVLAILSTIEGGGFLAIASGKLSPRPLLIALLFFTAITMGVLLAVLASKSGGNIF